MAWGVVAAFLAMGVAMVLPHHHDETTVQHICWICQAKATGAAPSVAAAQVTPALKWVSFVPNEPASVFTRVFLLTRGARAPPFLS